MTFDVLATAAIADELRKEALGGRIQAVLLPGPLAVGLEIYAHGLRRYLYATAQTDEARVQFVEAKLRRGPDVPSPLLLLLRKYVHEGRLTEAAQPGFERILRLTIHGPYGEVSLYFEVMGRHSNIILVDADGTILESIKRIPPRLSHRVVLPHHPYEPPPPQRKLSFASLTPGRLVAQLAESATESGPLWRKLVAQIAGLSPLAAREVVHRVTGDTQAEEADPAAILGEIASLMNLAKSSAWKPCIAWEEGKIVAFAPYPLTQYPQCEAMPTFSEAMTRYFSQERDVGSYAGAREELRQVIAAGRERLRKQAEAIQRGLATEDARKELLQKGQLILAYAGQTRPGQEELVIDLGDGKPILIALDPKLSAAENAQRYFREYEKLKAAAEGAPGRLQEVELKLVYLNQLETDLMLAANRPEIDQVRMALAEAGYLRAGPQRGQVRTHPGQYRSVDGLLILVGKNSQQNDMLTFRRARPHDIWLHARGIPGSHVIIVTEGQQVPENTLQQAAETAAYYSRGRNDDRVSVDYALQRNVRRIPDAGPGMVTYRGEKTLRVTPRDWLRRD